MKKIASRTELNEKEISDYAKIADIGILPARILLSRGIRVEEVDRYLYGKLSDLSDPYSYSDMKSAVKKIREHIERGNKIVLYGDYDCDGIGAVSIITFAFREKGIPTDYYIPVRSDEGYGLHIDSIRKIKEEKNADLIITVDCGITSVKEVEYCKELGTDIVVTDHHRPGDQLPDCILVDPCFTPELTPLCGAGVALYLVRALFGDDFARQFLDLCAISTVADMVPLVSDNRILVKYGLGLIQKGFTRMGVKALLKVSGIQQNRLNTGDVSFRIAPRINAAGRLKTAESALRLLITDDPTESQLIAEELNLQNAERQTIEKTIFHSALEKLKGCDFGKTRMIVLFDETWEEGVLGIAASKIVEYFNLPTILLTKSSDDTLKGSGRSITGVNLHELLMRCSDLLLGFGGHSMAAGMSLKRGNLSILRTRLNEDLSKFPKELFERIFRYDAQYSMFDVNSELVSILQKFEPFGYGNPTPVFYDSAPSVKFSVLKKKHLEGKTKIGKVVCFGKGDWCEAYNKAEKKSVLYTVEKNFFNGYESDQIKVKELFFDQFYLSKETAFEQFCHFSHECYENGNIEKSLKEGEDPLLHVFFDKELFDKFRSDHPDYHAIYRISDVFVNEDTVVLLPDCSFPFSYYGKIVVHGNLSESIIDYFSRLNASFVDGRESCDCPHFDLKEARRTYTAIYLILKDSFRKQITAPQELFAVLSVRGYPFDYRTFVLHFYVLLDVKLLKYENGVILLTNENKVDISRSPLYKMTYGKATD